MAVRPQPFRQIHLDFHTSEDIPSVAADFDADEFAATLERARVNSIQCFARCWHGWMYYDSQKFPDLVHPTLVRRDLLPAQIAACHQRGIKVPIYVAVQVDRANALRHPEWVQLSPAGCLGKRAVYEPGLGPALCLNTPFREFLFEHVRELFAMMPVDGFWFDGAGPQDCSCRYCLEAMLREGLDPSQEEVRRQFGLGVINRFMAEMFALVREHSEEATVFFNSGHIGTRHRAVADLHTHFEIESLPSGGWGYLHFPVATRYARTLGREVVGMTGKFHTSWGDFHSFKNRAALEFECFHMLALGAACSVGDQLHPNGKIDPHTYDLIGAVYEQVEAKEPWCREAVPVSEVAVVTPERDLPFYRAMPSSCCLTKWKLRRPLRQNCKSIWMWAEPSSPRRAADWTRRNGLPWKRLASSTSATPSLRRNTLCRQKKSARECP